MKRKSNVSQIVCHILLILLSIMVILPLVMLISVSLSDEKDIIEYGYSLFPKNFSLEGYKYVFKNPTAIFNAYKVTTIFSVGAMVLSVLFMSMLAYPLSRKFMSGRRTWALLLYFCSLFSGGLVPTYILNTQYLHLADTYWIYILPTLVSPWYVFMLRTFFANIPDAVHESAYMDGANEFQILFRIVMPMSKPAIATVALFTFLGKWQDWYTSMLYINDPDMISLQYLLQRMMNNIKMLQEQSPMTESFMNVADIPAETAQMAMAMVVAGPVLIIFPFFQKYFVKGVTVGAVKE